MPPLLPLFWLLVAILSVAWAAAETIVIREIARALRPVPRRRWSDALPAAFCILADLYLAGFGLAACLGHGPLAWGAANTWSTYPPSTLLQLLLIPPALLPGIAIGIQCFFTSILHLALPTSWPVLLVGASLAAAPFVRCRLLLRSPAPSRWKLALVLLSTHLPLLPLLPSMLSR